MKSFLFAASLLIVSGCTSSPASIQYYQLSPSKEYEIEIDQQDKSAENRAYIQLQHFEVTDYLKQSSLVMQLEGHQLHYSRQHVWAENLPHAMQEALLHDLNQDNENLQFSNIREPFHLSASHQLAVKVQNFLPTHHSTVVFSGEYWLIEASTKTILLNNDFSFVQPLVEDGYNHAIKEMRALIKRLSDTIKQDINSEIPRLN